MSAVVLALFLSVQAPTAFAGATWGRFQAEAITSLDGATATVVQNKQAQGGSALRVVAGTASFKLYADPVGDAKATSFAVRVRRDAQCGEEPPNFSVRLDGELIMRRGANSDKWFYKMIPIPDSILRSTTTPFLGTTHTFSVTFDNPYVDAACTRNFDIDMGGFWSVPVLHSYEMNVTAADGTAAPASAWSRPIVPPTRTKSLDSSYLRLVGAVTASGSVAENPDWSGQLSVTMSGEYCKGAWPLVEVRLGSQVVGRTVIDQEIWQQEFYSVPEGVTDRDVHVTLLNPKVTSTCARAVHLDWSHGSSIS